MDWKAEVPRKRAVPVAAGSNSSHLFWDLTRYCGSPKRKLIIICRLKVGFLSSFHDSDSRLDFRVNLKSSNTDCRLSIGNLSMTLTADAPFGVSHTKRTLEVAVLSTLATPSAN